VAKLEAPRMEPAPSSVPKKGARKAGGLLGHGRSRA
jgi:hypothetical protein